MGAQRSQWSAGVSLGASRGAIAIIVLVHVVLAYDAFVHDPNIGYDAGDHWAYVETLAEGRLPLPRDTREFFCPPLPYAIPALLRAIGVATPWAAKAAQGLNVAFSLALFAALLGICRELRPGDRRLAMYAVALLAIFPVYYRSFVQVRGEPMLAAFVVTSVWLALRTVRRSEGSWRDAAVLGAALGGVLLSRQWGGFVFPAIAAFFGFVAWRDTPRRRAHLQSLAVAFAVAGILGGWFYARSVVRFGSVAAFNRAPASFSTTSQPTSFYVGLGGAELFNEPVREAFPNEFFPIFYSDVWGDYWSYFLVRQPPFGPLRGGRPHVDSNRAVMAPYLGRVNAFSVLPTLFFALAVLLALAASRRLVAVRGPPEPRFATDIARALIVACLLCSLAGYAWFLIRHPIPDRGDTIKATYMLQVFPFVALLGAELLVRLRERQRFAHRIVCAVLIAVAVHHVPLFFTRYAAPLPGLSLFPGGAVETRPAPDAPGIRGGILAEYFHGTEFQRAVRVHDEESIRVHAAVRPIVGVNPDRFSVRWTGWLQFPTGGDFLLCSESDDGARVSLGRRRLIDDWQPHAIRRVCERVSAKTGWAPLEVEFRDLFGLAHMRMLRGRSLGSLQVVPAAQLCCKDAGAEDARL
ncbi:MAG: glycosyltransferase family 39 protein [Myxococcales bacterium]|nr:glycosyltransferase family 39 protein [Myxococcales bacterium]